MTGPAFDFSRNPLLVFWETTKACPLSCMHCRASAISHPLPDELTYEEAAGLIDDISAFGHPKPVLIMTGGDCMMREDLGSLVKKSRESQLSVALSPAVSDLLADEKLLELQSLGVKSLSLSLDGSSPEVHDGIRGLQGHFQQTIAAARRLVGMGFAVQINTTVMRDNVEQLADIALILRDLGIRTWEVFFLVMVGRGEQMREVTPEDNEDVCNFLADMTGYGFVVRTVEAPFFRRILAERHSGSVYDANTAHGGLYRSLAARARELLGQPVREVATASASTRDGKGIVFISQNGEVYPSGFLPYSLGNVRSQSIRDIYRESPTLIAIRKGEFSGKCGVCDYRDVCGGSRSRAFALTGDVLAADPGCIYEPQATVDRTLL